jgi:hypothetical protein
LQKYSLYTQGDREGRKLRDQEVGGLPAAENDAALAGANIHSQRFATNEPRVFVMNWMMSEAK